MMPVRAMTNIVFMLVALAAAMASAMPSLVNPRFQFETTVSGLEFPTSMHFLSTGQFLITEKLGKVRIYDPDLGLIGTPLLDISDQVNSFEDHGLLSVTASPDFSLQQGTIYVCYTYENNHTDIYGLKTGRVSAFTVINSVADPSSERILLGKVNGAGCPPASPLLDCIPSEGTSHSVGTIMFAPDGNLLVSFGDAAPFLVSDDLSSRSLDLNSLAGKIVRITTDGNGIADNPFYDGNPMSVRSKIYEYGIRNAFKFTLVPGSHTIDPIITGDVGWNTWERIYSLRKGQSSGWPCYEGYERPLDFQSRPFCTQYYTRDATVYPVYEWNHNGSSSAVIGGAFYNGYSYIDAIHGAYFFADYAQNTISYLNFNDDYTAVASGPFLFATAADGPVGIYQGTDDYLYYISFTSNEIRKLIYDSPLRRSLKDNKAFSPDFSSTSAATAINRYSLQSRDANSNQPIAVITSPAPGTRFRVGDIMNYSGYAEINGVQVSDARMQWQIELHHCIGDKCHIHIEQATFDRTGSFPCLEHADKWFYVVVLRVGNNPPSLSSDDANNINAVGPVASVVIEPDTVRLNVQSDPPGIAINIFGETLMTPFVFDVPKLATVPIVAPSVSGNLKFVQWSDGRAVTSVYVNVPADVDQMTMVAQFCNRIGQNALGPACA